MFDTSGQVQDIFDALIQAREPTGTVVLGHEWPGRPNDYAAVDSEGAAYLLIRERTPSVTKTELHRQHFHVYGGLSVVMRVGEQQKTGQFAAVKLLSTARTHMQSFAMLTSALMKTLPTDATGYQVSELIVRFSKLFSSDAQPDKRSIVGLWGELLFISVSQNPAALVRGWHASPNQLFDFSMNGQNLEVKTCSEHDRRHRFAHEQLSTKVESTSVVSIHVFESNDGESISDLLSTIATMLNQDEVELLLDRAYAVLGTYLESSSDYRYSLRSVKPIAVIPVTEFPTLEISTPGLVSQISYVVDVQELAISSVDLL